MNSCRANRLCQALLFTILIGSLFSGSAPTKPSKTKNSLSSTCFFIILNIFSNFSSGIGWLTLPQSMILCVTSSSTIYLSSGDLPVNFPVLTERAPVDERMPSFLLIMTSTSDGTDRLEYAFPSLMSISASCIIDFVVIIFGLFFVNTYNLNYMRLTIPSVTDRWVPIFSVQFSASSLKALLAPGFLLYYNKDSKVQRS